MVRYESHAEGVTAHFTDGTTAEGNVLVGADGIRLAVRTQRAPACQTMDAGVKAIYGRLPMAVARDMVPTETFEDIFTIATDERKVFLGLASVRFPMSPDQAAAKFSPTSNIRKQDDYYWGTVGIREEGLKETFFADGSAEDFSRARELIRPEPTAAFSTAISVTASSFGAVPRTYIRTTRDRALSPALQDAMLASTPCPRVMNIETSHCPMLAAPDRLATLLRDVAR